MNRRLLHDPRPWVIASILASAGSVALVACSSSSDSSATPTADVDAASETDASTDDPAIDPKYQAFADAFDAERAKLGASGASVAIMEHGKLTFFHGFGTKGPSSKDIVKATTLFRIGSMTKALTSTALLSLVAEKKVALDVPVSSIVSGLNMDDPEHMATMTLTHCLTHSSGLADYLQVDASHEDSGLAQFFTGAGALTWGKRDYFSDPPGSFYDYANPNFMLAGYVLEKVSGVPYRTAVHDRVLAPLGMNRTVFLPSEALADGDTTNGASTDASGKPWDVAPDSYDNSWARPAGYAFSSVLDYEKLLSFLLEGNTAVLPDDLRAQMQSAVVSTEDPSGLGGYGFGIENDSGFRLSSDYYDVPLVSHSGAIPGYATEWYLVPSTGFGIVAFANADGAYFGDSVALAFEAFADLPASTTPTKPAQDPDALAKIAGDYVDPHNVGHVTVSLSGTSLTVSMPDLDKARIPYSTALSPEGNGNFGFVVQGQEVEITFLKDGSGAYTWMRARPFVATRTAPAADGGAPLPVPFPGPPHLPTSAERHLIRPAERLAHAQLPAR